MFTGIIREIGTMEKVSRGVGSLTIRVKCPETASESLVGDSIAVNGVCLTATSVIGETVEMDVGEETYNRTTLARTRVNGKVNIEPALRVGGKLGGHFVTGHVDGVGRIVNVAMSATQKTYVVKFPRELAPMIAWKGGVAVDGISLTVGALRDDAFEVYIIPHTMMYTTLDEKKVGDTVNIEVDVLARYVYHSRRFGEEGNSLLRKLEEYEYIGEKAED